MALHFLDDLGERGLIHQCTDEPELRAHLDLSAAGAKPRRAYVGFDPTADSLTIGNLVPIMLLARFQRAGHTPLVVMGGGTGLIGDPSGKSAERQLMTRELVEANVASQRTIFERVLDFSAGAKNAAVMTNNVDWLAGLSYLDALRDVGKHFSVNQMIQRDSVRDRLHTREQGISYTEFSYMVLQAYDFLHLYRASGVTLQMGGSDQFGNIVSGCDLIRRNVGASVGCGADGALSFGLTTPLITKADGGKFGKTESGAVWLTAKRGQSDSSPARTSPYAFYQFWLNAADADVEKFLKTFTFRATDEIAAVLAKHAANPAERAPQRTLAQDMTDMLHGKAAREAAEAAAAALFSGDIAALPADLLAEVLSAAPTSAHDKGLLAGEGAAVLDVLATTLCKSKSEARQALTEGSVSVNGKKAAMADRLTAANLLHGSVIALRRGKKNWHVTRWA
ncbi:MAG: tyrosine--tRNA ligase [Phycisphaerales bacterium]